MARDLRGDRFRFPSRYRIVAKILFKFGSRSELRLYAVFESYAYMPFSSPTPICRFRVLRLYAVFESYAYMPFSSPTPICRFRVLRLYGLDSADTPMLQ